MKNFFFFLILIICFHGPVNADDIRDFEIEGVSIGDSLLKYFDKDEILQNIEKDYYKDNKFQTTEFHNLKKFKRYESISFSFKENDTKYYIVSMNGINFYRRNIKECYKDMSSIDNELNYLFKNLYRETDDSAHEADEKGESFVKAIRYWFDNDDVISIACYDWSKRLTDRNGWTDNLSIEITTKDFNEWLVNKAFN